MAERVRNHLANPFNIVNTVKAKIEEKVEATGEDLQPDQVGILFLRSYLGTFFLPTQALSTFDTNQVNPSRSNSKWLMVGMIS